MNSHHSECRLVSACAYNAPNIAEPETKSDVREICGSSQCSTDAEIPENELVLDSSCVAVGLCDEIGLSSNSNSASELISVNSSAMSVAPSIYSALTADELALVESDLEMFLNRTCPITYYDFCVVTCDIDYEEAAKFRSEFCKEYNLTGCMLYDPDIASLGEDIFDQYEAMMEISTKVFFYHTENYKKDHVHLRVQNGAVYQQLWERMRRDRDKCVPVFPNGSHRVGLALSGVSGLDPTIPDNMRRRVLVTFNDRIRKIRVLKQENAKRRRSELYKQLLSKYVSQYMIKKKSHLPISETESTSTALSETGILSLQETLSSLPIEEESQKDICKLVTESCENMSQLEQKLCDVSITQSSGIHIGPRIEVNVHINKSEGQECCHSSDSDDN
ncbi:uncharacterized protein [Periplaneta americana]|uniref:uncharacterized protein n=1 Tax=Periplaneta americana TaxID=6978 RepID=UPI0037E8E4F7